MGTVTIPFLYNLGGKLGDLQPLKENVTIRHRGTIYLAIVSDMDRATFILISGQNSGVP